MRARRSVFVFAVLALVASVLLVVPVAGAQSGPDCDPDYVKVHDGKIKVLPNNAKGALSAGTLAKMALGSCDDLLSTSYTCFSGPVLAAPAMNRQMWEHPAVKRNVEQLRADGVHLIDPEEGWLSCRDSGVGRMADPERILQTIKAVLST